METYFVIPPLHGNQDLIEMFILTHLNMRELCVSMREFLFPLYKMYNTIIGLVTLTVSKYVRLFSYKSRYSANFYA